MGQLRTTWVGLGQLRAVWGSLKQPGKFSWQWGGAPWGGRSLRLFCALPFLKTAHIVANPYGICHSRRQSLSLLKGVLQIAARPLFWPWQRILHRRRPLRFCPFPSFLSPLFPRTAPAFYKLLLYFYISVVVFKSLSPSLWPFEWKTTPVDDKVVNFLKRWSELC